MSDVYERFFFSNSHSHCKHFEVAFVHRIATNPMCINDINEELRKKWHDLDNYDIDFVL